MSRPAPAPPGSPPPRPEAPPLDPETLPRFVDRLPIPAVLRPMDPTGAPGHLPSYRVLMTEAAVKVHRDIPLTRVWTYGGTFPGPTVEARRDRPTRIEWINALPAQPFLPGGGETGGVRAAVHVHGALAPPDGDGDADGAVLPGRSITSVYPNAQEAATLWYHDDARAVARLHQYAGLLGVYLLRDEQEATLGLPAGPLELPLVICDRAFGQDGQLRAPGSEHAAPLVNGKLFPFADVPARRHRLRIVNASNAAACALSFDPPLTVHQIATDQGLLSAPIETSTVHLAPGERAELLADFGPAAGKAVVLRDRARELMQFRVANGAPPREPPLPARLRETPLPRPQPASAAASRTLMIAEPREHGGPLTERPRLHTAELWNLVNQSGTARVVHVHGVRFRVLDESPDGISIDGWKDTVRVAPAQTLRLWVQFDGVAGRYVWQSAALEVAAPIETVAFQVVEPPT